MSAVNADFLISANMPKTRVQKEKALSGLTEKLKNNNGFILVGFSKMGVNDLNDLRRKIEEVGGNMRVVKRRLLNLALSNLDIEFKAEDFIGQTGFVVFENLPELAGIINNFSKENEIDVLGGFDLSGKKVIEVDYIERVGQLPPREVLLGFVVGALSGPIRAFMYSLQEISKTK